MNKYILIPLKSVSATKEFLCYYCESTINPKEYYYIQKDRFLITLSNKRFCENCFKKYGQELLTLKKRNKFQKTLDKNET